MEKNKMESLFCDKNGNLIDLTDEFYEVIPDWKDKDSLSLASAKTIFENYIAHHSAENMNPKDFDTQAKYVEIMTLIKEIIRNKTVRSYYKEVMGKYFQTLFYDENNQFINIVPELTSIVPNWVEDKEIASKKIILVASLYNKNHKSILTTTEEKKQSLIQKTPAIRLIEKVIKNPMVRKSYIKASLEHKVLEQKEKVILPKKMEPDEVPHRFINLNTLSLLASKEQEELNNLRKKRATYFKNNEQTEELKKNGLEILRHEQVLRSIYKEMDNISKENSPTRK